MPNSATHTIDVSVSPARFYALLIDFESYPDFVPNQSAVRIVDASDDTWRIEFELSIVKRLTYELTLIGVPSESLRWRLLKGDMMKTNVGGWRIEALPDGLTRAYYDIDVTFKGFVPRSVSKALVERTLPANMAAFKAEAERRG